MVGKPKLLRARRTGSYTRSSKAFAAIEVVDGTCSLIETFLREPIEIERRRFAVEWLIARIVTVFRDIYAVDFRRCWNEQGWMQNKARSSFASELSDASLLILFRISSIFSPNIFPTASRFWRVRRFASRIWVRIASSPL